VLQLKSYSLVALPDFRLFLRSTPIYQPAWAQATEFRAWKHGQPLTLSLNYSADSGVFDMGDCSDLEYGGMVPLRVMR
jgi:hypothetical protein